MRPELELTVHGLWSRTMRDWRPATLMTARVIQKVLVLIAAPSLVVLEALSFLGQSTLPPWRWLARLAPALPSPWQFMEPVAKEYANSVIQTRRSNSFPE